MSDYFIFPVNFNDLEQEAPNHNRHRVFLVDLAMSDRDIIRRLKNIDSTFNENYEIITDPDNFDFLYSLIKGFSDNIEAKSSKILEELSSTIQYITELILKHLGMLSQESNTSKLRLTFKMVIFLCLYFISATSLKKQKAHGDLITEAMNKEKGRRKQKVDGYEPSRILLQNQKNCINLLKETLKVNFVVLWERKEIDTEFFKKYVDVCVKILQSNLVKDSEISSCIFEILESILNSNYCESVASTFQTVLANLVYEGDVIDNLVNFFAQAQGPQLQKLITQSLILVVIYLVNKQNLSSESQSIKNTRQFLSKVSQKIPKIFYTNLSCFITLFKHESYHLRNAITEIMANIFRQVFSGQQAQETYKESRQKFISTFLQRTYDKSSFCRSHVLGIMALLAVDKVVEKKYLILLLKAGIDRVKDVSINVRKKALQLINVVIDELCTKEAQNVTDLDRQIEIAELELKTLQEEEEKLKTLIDQTEDEDQLEELISNVRLIKKQMKITQEREIGLFEEKETNALVTKTIQSIKILLGSKADSDVLETIKLFIKLHKLGFEKARDVLPDIRTLIFSKEKKIKDEVLTNFVYLHLGSKSDNVAQELMNLFATANHQDQSALEQILETVISQSLSKNIVLIKPQVFSHMWNNFIKYQREQINEAEKRAIITILRIAFSKDFSLIKEENVESFLNMLKAYVENNEPDFHIVKQISKIICLDYPMITKAAKNFLVAQIYILVNTQGVSNNDWFSACQCILTCIFKICQSPERLVNLLIKKLHEKLEQTQSTKAMCHFIHTLAHACLKCLIFLDSIESKIKGIKQKQLISENVQGQEELDKVMGGVEAQLERKIEEINLISEKMLEDPFVNKWLGYIQKIVLNYKSNTQLEIISVLAYCKFLCLSAPFCQQKFAHVAKLLTNSQVNSVTKNNIIISMGDLLHRFPNVIQPYNRYLYMNLHEKDPRVRKTTLTVITHLSLNDMIKVKSDMCDIALLFQDPDPQIESLVKQFFNEMNKKDPKVLFNLIPDALSRFSNVEKLGNESTFKIFIENIVPLLEKDKYSESLVIKLCERLANSLNLLEIANTAYCLSEINVNEKGLRRIIENFQQFRKTLENQEVFQSFKNLIMKLKRSQKTEIKPLAEELQQKVSHFNEEIFNAEEIKKRNQERLIKKQPKKKGEKMTSSRRGRKSRPADIEYDQQSQMDDQSQPELRNRPQRTNRRMRVIKQSQDEVEDEDDEFVA